jgi:hypothetical protein
VQPLDNRSRVEIVVQTARQLPPIQQRLVMPQQKLHDRFRALLQGRGHGGALGGEQRFVQGIAVHRLDAGQDHFGH